jgi:hypothetical protein
MLVTLEGGMAPAPDGGQPDLAGVRPDALGRV